MGAVDLMTRRRRYEIYYQWELIAEVFVLNDNHIVFEDRLLMGIQVRRGKRA